MTTASPISIGVPQIYTPYTTPECAIYSDGTNLFVKYAVYAKEVFERLKVSDELTQTLEEHNEQLQLHLNGFDNIMSTTNRTWSKQFNLSEREKVVAAIAIVVLAALVIALAVALTVSLAILL